MGKVIVFMNLTLDGVMQAPGTPDEDRRGGFEHGGWGVPYNAMAQAGDSIANIGALLLGRRTYEGLYAYWPNHPEDPISAMLDNLQKYVASTTLSAPLPWVNTALLAGDATQAVATLKQEMDRDLVIMGSGELIQSLRRDGLIDEYVLLVHPLVLGGGRRLFPEGGAAATLQLVSTKSTDTGVVIVSYRPTLP